MTTPRLSILRTLAAAACTAATLTATHAAVIDIVWDANGRLQRRDSVAPGTFVEVCGKLPRGLSVAWSFEADRVLDFNIHHHVGETVVFSAKRAAVSRAGDTLVAPAEHDYCWMWSNKGQTPVALELRLSKP